MEDRRATGAPRQAQDPSWLAREGEWVGMVPWAVGITTLAWLPDTRVCSPRYPPMFVVLKLVAAWLWLLVGVQGWQRWARRPPRPPEGGAPAGEADALMAGGGAPRGEPSAGSLWPSQTN
jgi:hypothetical protein